MKAGLQLLITAFFVIFAACQAFGQDASNDKQVVESFRTYMQQHFASYEHNRRERTTLLSQGWMKMYYQPDQSSAGIDVQRTASLVSPYIGTLEFKLVNHFTAFHKSRKEAESDSTFVNSKAVSHTHTYAYQDGKWVPKTRKHVEYGDTYNCDEVISVGENAGERDINGCLEEYDKP
jgi:hypothetical protein